VNMVEVTDVSDDEEDEDDDDDPFAAVADALARRRSYTTTTTTMQEEEEEEDGTTTARTTGALGASMDGMTTTLAELEEERELSRRRSSACVMLAIFVLFRLWISCLQSGDVTLLLLCLLGTSWTVRWIRYNREREEELDERIEQYISQQQQQQNNAAGNGGNGTDRQDAPGERRGGGIIVDRNELRMLSFQAQLSLAIMESQRHMMETGGYGRGHGDDQPSTPGVSEQAKQAWKRFSYQSPPGDKKGPSDITTTTKGVDNKLYGSLSSSNNPTKGNKDKLSSEYDDELPHCSICLGEYEDGEALVQLPCGHLYHDSCIASWTASHTKCPLCNLDLESVAVTNDQTKNHNNSSGGGGTNTGDSIV
jgi:Ring finger domain